MRFNPPQTEPRFELPHAPFSNGPPQVRPFERHVRGGGDARCEVGGGDARPWAKRAHDEQGRAQHGGKRQYGSDNDSAVTSSDASAAGSSTTVSCYVCKQQFSGSDANERLKQCVIEHVARMKESCQL